MLRRVSRRDFLKTMSATAGVCISSQACRGASTQSINTNDRFDLEKPNILFILIDDLGKEWISAYGATDIETPNIDALAENGILFTNAYSMAICGPSRVTLLTGQYPWRTGWTGNDVIPQHSNVYFDWTVPQNRTFAHWMKDLGYVTCAAGKWQINDFSVEPGVMKNHGFDEWCMWVGTESGFSDGASRYWDAHINTNGDIKEFKDQFAPDIYRDFLINFMRRHTDTPMCIYYPMVLTHVPVTSTPDEPNIKSALEKHKAMVRYTDKIVGQLVEELDSLGIRDRTVIVLSTDNGTNKRFKGTIKGHKVQGGKDSQSESGVCVPFIVNCPVLLSTAIKSSTLTDFTDILPTFVDLGGGHISDDVTIDGFSLAPLLLGQVEDSARTWIMALGDSSEEGENNSNFARRVIRDKQFKVYVSPEKMITHLYNLQSDLWEEKNLLDGDNYLSKHENVLSKFQTILNSLPDQDAQPNYRPRMP